MRNIKKIKLFIMVIFIMIMVLFLKSTLLQVINNEYVNVDEMKRAELKIGDIVKTKGYYQQNDNGGATYEIMSYEQWYEELPEDLKAVAYLTDELGNPVWSKTMVDGYGNHTLNNGLVAKIVNDDVITPEQWGCIGDGITDNTEQLIHLFSFTKSGYIKFKENATYLMKSRPKNRYGYSNNEYIWLMCGAITAGASQGKPLMANINDVVLDGNNCTIKINDNDFSNNTNDFGIFEFSGFINELEIKNFNFDGNGLSLVNENTRTTNHTLVYLPSDMNAVQLTNGTGEIMPNIPNRDKESEFSNVSIHDNNFKDSGTAINTQDGGGDFILIINPKISHDVNIECNYFENWGRWVFSVDLGGNGECFENYKFNNNICIQNNKNKINIGKYRGLGWIDFEAQKSWKNLEVKNNVIEGVVGFAINGSGEISEHINIYGNYINYLERDYISAYIYTFSFYGVQAKNLTVENNIINSNGEMNLGYSWNNVYINNNKVKAPFQVFSMYNNIIFNDNEIEGNGYIVRILGIDVPDYLKYKKDKICNFVFKNNHGGIEGAQGKIAMFFEPSDMKKYEYINIFIDNNYFSKMNISVWDTDVQFDPNQYSTENFEEYFQTYNSFSVRGAKFTSPIIVKEEIKEINKGGGIYNKGDIVAINLETNEKLICISEGYIPVTGAWGFTESDIKFLPYLEVNKYSYIYTDTAIYISCNQGTLGEKINSKDDIVLCGEVKLKYLGQLAKFEIIK